MWEDVEQLPAGGVVKVPPTRVQVVLLRGAETRD